MSFSLTNRKNAHNNDSNHAQNIEYSNNSFTEKSQYSSLYQDDDANSLHAGNSKPKFNSQGFIVSNFNDAPVASDTFNSLAYKVGFVGFSGDHIRKLVIGLTALTVISIVGAIVAASVASLGWAMIPLAIAAGIYSIFPLYCAAHKAYHLISDKLAERKIHSNYYSSVEENKTY